MMRLSDLNSATVEAANNRELGWAVTAIDNLEWDKIIDERDKRDERSDLDKFNEKFAVVRLGGKTRVVSMEPSPTHPDSMVPIYSSIQDFKAFFAHPRKLVPSTKGGQRMVGIGQWWIDHEHRRQYDGIVYAPNEKTPGKLNLWQGFGCKPAKGDCDLYLDHLHAVICNGNDEHFDYLLGWVANAVQNPGTPGAVAVVLKGKEGTGKGVVAKQLGILFGAHFRHVANGKHLTGHFNAHLQNCSLLFADEAFFAGDRSHESILKQLITEETFVIEPKGLDSYEVRNCIHLIMASNSEWVVPAGADARRYFVLDVADHHKQDHEYFAKLLHQMDNGGREALLDYLQKLDLEQIGFRLRKVPHTDALADQKARSRRGIDRLVETIAEDGKLPAADPMHPNVAITSGEPSGQGFYVEARKLAPDLRHESSNVIVRTLTRQWGCRKWKSGLKRGIQFPALSTLRAEFDAKHGPQEWSERDDDWAA